MARTGVASGVLYDMPERWRQRVSARCRRRQSNLAVQL